MEALVFVGLVAGVALSLVVIGSSLHVIRSSSRSLSEDEAQRRRRVLVRVALPCLVLMWAVTLLAAWVGYVQTGDFGGAIAGGSVAEAMK